MPRENQVVQTKCRAKPPNLSEANLSFKKGKKKQKQRERTKKNISNSRASKQQKSSAGGSLPHVPNALTLEAYISVAAHLVSVGVSLLFCCCLSIIGRSVDSNQRTRNRRTLLLPLRHRGLLVKGKGLLGNILFQHLNFIFFFHTFFCWQLSSNNL